FTPCAIKYACEGPDWPSSGTAADIQKAKDLLTQAGFPNGFKTKIQYRNVFRGYLPQPPVVAQDLKEQLAKIGIDATVEEQESGTLIANANSGKLDGLFLLGWGADYPEVTNFMDYHFGGGCTAAFGKCYPDIATPLGKGNSTTDDAARTAAYTEANQKLIDVVPILATECTPNTEGTVWTCKLRQGVTFHDGSTFEAQDVVTSFAVQWDAANPLHKGNTGIFEYWAGLWGGNLNPPPPKS